MKRPMQRLAWRWLRALATAWRYEPLSRSRMPYLSAIAWSVSGDSASTSIVTPAPANKTNATTAKANNPRMFASTFSHITLGITAARRCD